MTHPLVLQLQFTRAEFQRGLKGVSEEDALHRFEPMNCISWIVGHMAWQEQLYWLTQAQDITPVPEVNLCASGQPASTPSLQAMWAAWKVVTAEVDKFLEPLNGTALIVHTPKRSAPSDTYKESIGTRIRRTTYHYWYHTGESQAIRQLLGHERLGQFVGNIGDKAPYIPE
jgi:hypothetical protein